jgi:ParB family transcriptional regulator, chromosome partitioning protein
MTKKRLTLDSLLSGASDDARPAQRQVASPVNSGALKAMTESLQRMSDGAAEADRLRDELQRAERVLEINTDLIERSFVRDRFNVEDEAGISELAESIAATGQQVPVLLRPHPDKTNCFQIAYGHRRVEASRRLAVAVRAIVRPLSDAELVIAQGKENLDRRDLSFIERAWFARELEDRGFDRRTIMAALGIAKSDLSVLISIARDLPETLVKSIGAAPKVGKPRWMSLAAAWKTTPGRDLEAVVGSEDFRKASSDERFALVSAALLKRAGPATLENWTDPEGQRVVQVSRNKQSGVLTVDERIAPAFTDFLLQRIPELFDAYRREQNLKS